MGAGAEPTGERQICRRTKFGGSSAAPPPKNFRVSSFPDVSVAEEDEVVEAFQM